MGKSRPSQSLACLFDVYQLLSLPSCSQVSHFWIALTFVMPCHNFFLTVQNHPFEKKIKKSRIRAKNKSSSEQFVNLSDYQATTQFREHSASNRNYNLPLWSFRTYQWLSIPPSAKSDPIILYKNDFPWNMKWWRFPPLFFQQVK